MNLRIGTIRSRHPLPVDRYLLDGPVAQPGQAAYDAAATAALELTGEHPNIDHVDLYYTGLTEVLLGTLDAFRFAGVAVTPWRWDAEGQMYEPLERRRPPSFVVVAPAL